MSFAMKFELMIVNCKVLHIRSKKDVLFLELLIC